MSSQVPSKALVIISFTLTVTEWALADNSAFVLNDLVIESTRINSTVENTPQVVSIITRDQIEEQLSLTTDSSTILSNLLPAYGLNTQKLNSSSETFRGRSVLYMIDGVPQSNPLRDSSRAAHTIDMAMVDHIEVIHGSTAIHGLGATGGIINFITKVTESDPIKQHLNLQLTTPADSLNSDTLSYKIGYQVEGTKDEFDYLLGISGDVQGAFLDSNGNTVGADNIRGDLMDSKSLDTFAKLGYWIDDSQNIKFQLYHQDFEGRFGATQSTNFQDESLAAIGTLYDQSQVESEKVGTKISLTKNNLLNGKLSLTTGFDALQDTTQQSLVLTNRVYVPKTSYINYAPFIQTEFKPMDRVTVQAGARYEKAKLDVDTYKTVAARNGVTVEGGSPSFSDTMYNAGIVFRATSYLNLFANYSQGFGMPDVGRVLRSVNQTNQNVNTLIDLNPIITNNHEVGFRIDKHPVDFEFSYYETNSDLGSRIIETNGIYSIKREKTEINGVEATVGFQAHDAHRLELGYSYINGKSDTDNDGNVDTKLTGSNIPANRLITSWRGHWNDKISTLIQMNHAFDRSFDNDALEFEGYTLLDASLGYKLPIGKLNISVANTLNKDHFTYYSQSSATADNLYFKGRGRTLTVDTV